MPGPPGWVQRQKDALAEQERRRAMAGMPPSHKHAFELLVSKRIAVESVVRVDSDAILFLAGPGKPRTAWLLSGEAGLRVWVEDGFPCEPSEPVRLAFGT